MTPAQFVLTHEDKQSPVWRKLVKHWESRLELLRTQNDGDKDLTDTATLRGRIAECKANLNLAKELQPPQ